MARLSGGMASGGAATSEVAGWRRVTGNWRGSGCETKGRIYETATRILQSLPGHVRAQDLRAWSRIREVQGHGLRQAAVLLQGHAAGGKEPALRAGTVSHAGGAR